MFSHQGHTYYPSRFAPSAPFLRGRNLLGEFERECKKRGVRLVVYLNSKWVTDLYGERPDWIVRFKDGPFVHSSQGATLTIYPMCPSTPFMDYFKNIVREVTSLSYPDAIYIDNFGIEPFCRCNYCRKSFGGKIPAGKNWNSKATQKYLRWFVRESEKIARGIVWAARGSDPRMPVIFNRGRFWSETERYSPENNYRYAHRIADGIHTESAVRFYGEPFEHINEQCTFGRSIGVPVWTWVEYPMLPFSYMAPSPEEAKIKAAKVTANGGRPMVWNMPCTPLVNQKGMSGIREVFRLVAANEDIFNDVDFEKFAGIVFSSKSVRAYCRGSQEKLKEYKKTFAGACQLMIRNHVPYDFILDGQITYENLKKYKAIVLPSVIHLNRFQCGQIKRYVAGGGAIFATYETSLYGEDGRRLGDFALKDVLGAKYTKNLGEQFEGYSAGYCRFVVEHQVNKGLRENLFPMGGKYLAVEARGAIARLLKRCRYYCDFPQEETEYPAVVAREYGKGKVIYVPGEFFKLYHEKGFLEYSQFLKQSIEWFVKGRMPIITDLPDTVELTITRNRKGFKIIHLVNCSFDKTRAVENIIPVRGKYLKIGTRRNYEQALDISAKTRLKMKREGGYFRINLPELTGYNVVVLK